ncbi:MAG: hypothetical protein ABIN25_12375 [Ginsengibacter sp.]
MYAYVENYRNRCYNNGSLAMEFMIENIQDAIDFPEVNTNGYYKEDGNLFAF